MKLLSPGPASIEVVSGMLSHLVVNCLYYSFILQCLDQFCELSDLQFFGLPLSILRLLYPISHISSKSFNLCLTLLSPGDNDNIYCIVCFKSLSPDNSNNYITITL